MLARLALIPCLLLLLGLAPARGAERPDIDPPQLAARIHELANLERQAHGLQPLAWNDALAEIAAEHSADMRARSYLSHVNPEGETPTDRGNRAGYRCRTRFDGFYEEGLAENLCRNSLFHATRYTYVGDREIRERLWNSLEQLAESTVRSWMEHDGHRENILNPRHGSEGIGIAIAEDGKVYVTQLFC